MPVFFTAGSPSQLIFGIVVTFVTFGAYSTLKPYSDPTDMKLANLGQVIIFLTLISSLARPLSLTMDVVLTGILAFFMVTSALLSFPLPKACASGKTAIVERFSRRSSITMVTDTKGTDAAKTPDQTEQTDVEQQGKIDEVDHTPQQDNVVYT